MGPLWISCAFRVGPVLRAMPNQRENLSVARRLARDEYSGIVAATAKFDDEAAQLEEAGLAAFNLHAEAGSGFAEHVLRSADEQGTQKTYHRR